MEIGCSETLGLAMTAEADSRTEDRLIILFEFRSLPLVLWDEEPTEESWQELS